MTTKHYLLAIGLVALLCLLAYRLYGWMAFWGVVFTVLSLMAAVGLGWHWVEDVTEERGSRE